jgi:flagellar basal-body rod protein FlgB
LADALSTHDDPEARARRVRETVPRVERVETSLRADGNNVEIDLEAALLAENSIHYDAVARMMTARGRLLRTAVNEGRR